MEKKHYVYILKCADGTLYTGWTTDPERRLKAHNSGKGAKYEEGHLQDIIAGDFFICYAPIESEKFLSMPPELEEKYLRKFEEPERFFRDGDEIRAEKYTPRLTESSRDYAR